MTLAQVAEAVFAALPAQGAELVPIRVCTDSRAVAPGDLFVCLKGERFDAHDFAAQAVAAGAMALLAHRPLTADIGVPVLQVEDTGKALMDLARAWRLSVRAKVVGLSGSAGKTTVKEMLAQVLAAQFRVARTQGNFNNQVGLPLSMLAAEGDEDVWVMELGISQPGDMRELAPTAAPDLALVHNIGPAHLEGLGDLAGVAEEKATLLGYVRPGGHAVASRDYPDLWAAAKRYFPAVTAMSTVDADAPFFCAFLETTSQGGRFLLKLESERLEAELPFYGTHFAENLAAVAAGASLLGMSAGAVVEALARVELPGGRFSRREFGPFTLIDDSYNANPLSIHATLTASAAIAGDRPLILVLGDMLELGAEAEAEHEKLGRNAAACGPAAVVYRGAMADPVARSLEHGGFAGRFAAAATPDALAELVAEMGLSEGVFLVKGSRSCRMEEFSALLTETLAAMGGEKA